MESLKEKWISSVFEKGCDGFRTVKRIVYVCAGMGSSAMGAM